jgi:D-3-phosphoglycerate dehydrogenase / 2-oxoglutarate reductase
MAETHRRPLIVIADCDFPSTEVERRILDAAGVDLVVGQCHTEDEVIDLCADADGIIIQYAPLSRRVIESLKRCRVISRYGVGVDTVDVAAATERGIWVANVPNFSTVEVAEHTLALLLALARRLFPLDDLVHRGGWSTIDVMQHTVPLVDQTLGLIGFGAIARAVAFRARALGLRVLTYSPHTLAKVTLEYGVEQASLGDLFARSDYVSLHCPLTAETRHIIDATALRQMKPSAYLINTARGQLVDQGALVQAIHEGRLAGAALDVLEHEPISPGDPLLGMRNVILTPHSAFYSVRSLEDLQTRAAENVVDVLRGEAPHSAVNKVETQSR